jgi:hypothetical protein
MRGDDLRKGRIMLCQDFTYRAVSRLQGYLFLNKSVSSEVKSKMGSCLFVKALLGNVLLVGFLWDFT